LHIQNFAPVPAIARAWHRLTRFFAAMTLKARVVLLVVVLFFTGIWTLALSVTMALERDLTQMLSANLTTEAVNVADDLDRDVRLYVDALNRLAASLTPAILSDPAKTDRALDLFADTSAIVPHDCFVADAKGNITAGYPEDAVKLGASIADLGYFRELIASGKPVIGAPVAAAGAVPAVPIAIPLRNGAGATMGALVGSVLVSDPLSFGQIEGLKVGRTGWFLVVTPHDRRIVAATDRTRVGTRLPGHGVISLLDRRFEQGFEGPGVVVASIGPEVLSVGRKMQSTGWFVIASNPTAELFAPIVSLKRHIYFAALLISLAVAAILRFFLARQFAPLAQAAGAMRRMTKGEIPLATIAFSRQDEIGELIGNFNLLVAERSRLDQSLQAEIVKRKQMNDALRESTDRLKGVYQSVGEGIVSIDAEQRIVMFNTAAEQIFGYAAADLIGQPLTALIPERFRSQHASHIQKFDSNGQTMRPMGSYGLIYGRRANGEEFPLEASVSQSGVEPNKLFTVILRDITERMQAEQVREQLTRQLELLSQRLATAQEDERGKIAHELHEELGQELTALKFYLQARDSGRGGKTVDASNKEALATVAHVTARVRRLVLDLEPRELTDFGLHSAARSYCQLQATAGGWNLHIDAPKPKLRASRAVERACFRVIQEGLSNVLYHAKASEVWVSVHQGADLLELRIRDNGIGFDRSQVREDDAQSGGHVSGSLGLFGMQIRAKRVGGSVEVKSTPGGGTELLAVFPLDLACAEPG